MEQEPIQTEEIAGKIDETPGDDPQTQLEEMAAKLEKAEASLKERDQKERSAQVDALLEENKVPWAKALVEILGVNIADLEIKQVDEFTAFLSREIIRTVGPKQIGEPSNMGRDPQERTTQAQLKAAETKARQSGKAEDRSYFSTLKQKLGGNK